MLGRDVAAVDDFQRRDQFGAEIPGALAHAGERRERLNQRPLAHLCAEIGLHPPDGGQHVPADAVGLFRVGERRRVTRHRRLAVGNPLLVDQARDIVPDRRLELRLLLLELQHLRVRLKPCKRPVKCRARDSGALGVGAQARDAGGKVRPRGEAERKEACQSRAGGERKAAHERPSNAIPFAASTPSRARASVGRAASGSVLYQLIHSLIRKAEVCRQTPEAGAVCGRAARTGSVRGARSNARPYRNSAMEMARSESADVE